MENKMSRAERFVEELPIIQAGERMMAAINQLQLDRGGVYGRSGEENPSL